MSSDPLPRTPEYLAHMLRHDTAAFLGVSPDAVELLAYSKALRVLVEATEDSLRALRHAAIAIVNDRLVG